MMDEGDSFLMIRFPQEGAALFSCAKIALYSVEDCVGEGFTGELRPREGDLA